MRVLAIALTTTLCACSAAQVQSTTAVVAVKCQQIMPLANAANLIPVYGTYVALGVQVGCATDAGLNRLASDPTSAEWLDRQAASLSTVLRH